MKKLYVIAAVAMAALMLSCSKEAQTPETNPTEEATGVITINATLADLNTKVAFTPGYTDHKTTSMTLAWADGDKLRVYNHADPTQYSDFDLAAGSIGQKTGSFSGTPVTAASYDVEIINGAVDFGAQTQPSDGVTSDLKYMAQASEVTNLASISFTEFSSVLSITAQMPSTAVAATVKSVDITASEAIFNSGNTLTITLGTLGDAGADGILHLFANLPVGDKAIPAGTTLLMHFNAPGEAHDVYTRFVELPATTFKANKLNTINVNASQSDKHAGPTSCDGSDASKAYLIGDKYQMAAVPGLTALNSKKFFKLLNDIDMSGMTWEMINNNDNKDNADYTKSVDFDGNGKTVTNLPGTMFYVFKGSIKNLTLDSPLVTSGKNKGAFAQFIQGTDNYITNVDINNVATFEASSGNCGGLVGRINSGSTGKTTATFEDCDLTDVVVNSGGQSAGGFIGSVEAKVVMKNCTRVGKTVTNTSNFAGGLVGKATTELVIDNCSVSSTEEEAVKGLSNLGGLVGSFASGSITNSYAEVNVVSSSTDTYSHCGGLVGLMTAGVIEKCHATGNVTSDKASLGGLIGEINGNADIQKSYATGNVAKGNTKYTYRGALVGLISSSATVNISNCYATGEVEGYRWCSGILGAFNASALTVTNCFTSSTLTLSAPGVAGVFIGKANNKTVTYSGIIGWNTSGLSNFIYEATVTSAPAGNYFGTTGTISSQATALGWDTNIWDLTGDVPVLK